MLFHIGIRRIRLNVAFVGNDRFWNSQTRHFHKTPTDPDHTAQGIAFIDELKRKVRGQPAKSALHQFLIFLARDLQVNFTFLNKHELFKFFVSALISTAIYLDQQFVFNEFSSQLRGSQYLRQNAIKSWQVVLHPVGSRKDHITAEYIDTTAA